MDKWIDILVIVIKGYLMIFDLLELELMYVLLFGLVKDLVNMLGYVVMNIVEGFSEIV